MDHKIKYSIIIALTYVCGLFPSCVDLDIPPMNVIQDKDLMSSEEGMALYMSRMYSQMPYEDFKYSPDRGFFDDFCVAPGTHEGSSIGRGDCRAVSGEGFSRDATYARPSFWNMCFELLRDANYLLESLPQYKENFSEESYNHFMGEGYYIRAYVFYSMAKRYGGIPLVTKVLKYPENTAEELEVPRSTEEETWNQILNDFDKAASLLSEISPKRGYANKYVALGFKSEAMLFAGGIAKYNTPLDLTGFGQKTGVRVIGFDSNTAAAASKKYYTEAYKAAREIMKSGKYSLYKTKWSATDREAQYENMVDLFLDANSSENLYIREYKFPDDTHGYDIYNGSSQHMKAMGVYNNPTLDLVELYDGIDRHSDGTLKTWNTNDRLDPNRRYILFEYITDIFQNIEPRARAFIIFPGDDYRGFPADIRKGIFTGDVPAEGIPPLMEQDGVLLNYDQVNLVNYDVIDAYTAKSGEPKGRYSEKVLFMSADRNYNDAAEDVTLPPGSKILDPGATFAHGSGQGGPLRNETFCTISGFYVRKHMSKTFPMAYINAGREAACDHHCVLLRYGEILLNVAEAAAELRLAGESSVDGDDLSNIAYNAIKDIRERAGANPLASASELDGWDGLLVIRKERRKELPFENKILWDIRRWRTQHSDFVNGRSPADGARWRILCPFYSSKEDKFFFDARMDERNKEWRFNQNQYYFQIPVAEVNKSSVLDQQPTY
jgi:hypothetical protein